MKTFADIGELGWALYLSAYIRYLNKQGEETTVITDRGCLYENSNIEPMPKEFFEKFGGYPADCFGRFGVGDTQIREFFGNICDDLKFGVDWSFKDKTIYKPYPSKTSFKNSILIFPRYREGYHHGKRNLSYDFYNELIMTLHNEFPSKSIVVAGNKESYDMGENKGFVNLRGKTSMQELIDLCSSAFVTVGGTSAPPKLALLQGTPSFIIGHEKERFTVKENWMKTKVGFYEIPEEGYLLIDNNKCIAEIVEFIKCL